MKLGSNVSWAKLHPDADGKEAACVPGSFAV